jgi:hypothetical protein
MSPRKRDLGDGVGLLIELDAADDDGGIAGDGD